MKLLFLLQNLFCFVDQRERVLHSRKEATSGHVRDIYRAHHFDISIAGFQWIVPDPLRATKLSATMLIKESGKDCYETLLITESVYDQTGPLFTKRAHFKPLTMKDSQNYAMNTILHVEISINEEKHLSFEISLAQLLWDQVFDFKFPTYVPSSVRGSRKIHQTGYTSLHIVRGRDDVYSFDDHKIRFLIRTSGAFCRKVPDPSMKVAFSVAAEKGRWSRLSLSDAVVTPYRFQGGRTFPTIHFRRGELKGFNPRNPVRMTLYGTRKGYMRVLGFCQFTMAELARREDIHWYGKRLKKAGLMSVCTKANQSTSFSFELSTFGQVEERIMTVARNRIRDERLSDELTPDREDVNMTPSFGTASDISTSWSSFKSVLSFKKNNRMFSSNNVWKAKGVRTETVRFPGDIEDNTAEIEINMLSNLTATTAREIASRADF